MQPETEKTNNKDTQPDSSMLIDFSPMGTSASAVIASAVAVAVMLICMVVTGDIKQDKAYSETEQHPQPTAVPTEPPAEDPGQTKEEKENAPTEKPLEEKTIGSNIAADLVNSMNSLIKEGESLDAEVMFEEMITMGQASADGPDGTPVSFTVKGLFEITGDADTVYAKGKVDAGAYGSQEVECYVQGLPGKGRVTYMKSYGDDGTWHWLKLDGDQSGLPVDISGFAHIPGEEPKQMADGFDSLTLTDDAPDAYTVEGKKGKYAFLLKFNRETRELEYLGMESPVVNGDMYDMSMNMALAVKGKKTQAVTVPDEVLKAGAQASDGKE